MGLLRANGGIEFRATAAGGTLEPVPHEVAPRCEMINARSEAAVASPAFRAAFNFRAAWSPSLASTKRMGPPKKRKPIYLKTQRTPDARWWIVGETDAEGRRESLSDRDVRIMPSGASAAMERLHDRIQGIFPSDAGDR